MINPEPSASLTRQRQPVFGIVGWKNSGKTTLLCALVSHMTRLGYRVATLKHAHHAFDIDHEGTDSFRHRKAGAIETALVSSRRWAIMHELVNGYDQQSDEPDFETMLAKIAPCDLILVEGYKRENHPKLEIIADSATHSHSQKPLWQHDPSIKALACDDETGIWVDPESERAPNLELPRFARNDIAAIADFILSHLGCATNATAKVNTTLSPTGKAELNDCFLHDKDRLRHAEALEILKSTLPVIAKPKSLSLSDAVGTILAQPITAPRNIPAFDNSAVDGYAFRAADICEDPTQLPVEGKILAGDLGPPKLAAGKAVRIFTGAIMPEGADTIAMQEDCHSQSVAGQEVISIPGGLNAGANCRLAGEDVKRDQILMQRGNLLRPQDIAAIASTGLDTISTFSPLRVILFSSGDEIVRPGNRLARGQVYDSNHFLIRALCENLNVTVTDGGVLEDDPHVVQSALLEAANSNDVILTTGGASRGDEDHMVSTLDQHGSRHLWQLAIKPGRPMTFGNLGESLYFGLPGNPVASFVCFLLYVRPALLKAGGAQWIEPKRFPLPAGFEIRSKKPDRREFLRATMKTAPDGTTILEKFPSDGSGLISGLRAANGLVELSEETLSVSPGDLVNFIPFSEFGIV